MDELMDGTAADTDEAEMQERDYEISMQERKNGVIFDAVDFYVIAISVFICGMV